MENLPVDIISIIFEYLDTKDLILSSRTCWKFRNTFRKYIGKYKLDLRNYCKKITNEGLKYLKGVHTIDIEGCKKITNEGLKYLKGVHTI
ncbi:MAG TPA: F-box protein, partial [Saprospiraceae bacterium]|nr:F-box protein [Saprospiraceae bacterium]